MSKKGFDDLNCVVSILGVIFFAFALLIIIWLMYHPHWPQPER